MSTGKFFSAMVLTVSLIFLPSCKWFQKNDSEQKNSHSDGSPTLLSIGGNPALTAKEFDDFINKAAEGNEQIKLWMQFVPNFKEQIFSAKKRSLIINEWAKRQKLHDSKEYKDKEKMILDSIREQLDAEEFLKRLEPEVSDLEAQKHYEESKNHDPKILIAAAGTSALGVSFDNQNSANEFAETLKKSQGRDIEKLSKDKKLKVNQFGIVNNDSTIDAKIKSKILSTKLVPSVFVVKDEKGKNWVVVAKSKEVAQYRPFEQVKDVIKKMLKPKKLEEMLEKELPKLEKEYNVVENKAHFEELNKQAQKEAEEKAKAMADALAAQQSASKSQKPAAPQPVAAKAV